MGFHTRNILIFLLISGILFSLATLMAFPFVHSDETWLGSLSEAMLEADTLRMTEPAFDLYPRFPHAIRIFFNLLQILAIRLFGFRVLVLRALSLLAAWAGIGFLAARLRCETHSADLALALTVAAFWNVQFLYMSHFARQEALLFLILAIQLWYLSRPDPSPMRSGLLAGLAIGIHPNSFLIFLPVLAYWIHRRDLKKLNFFVIVVGAIASGFVLFSLVLDPQFIPHYLGYGETLGVRATLLDKLLQLRVFYLKLYYGVSGTYYTPDLRIFFPVAALAVVTAIVLAVRRKIPSTALWMLLALHIGYILIGRYNQTSFIFLLPILFLIAAQVLAHLPARVRRGIVALLLAVTVLNTGVNVLAHPRMESYDDYLSRIQEMVPDEGAILGNLNTLPAFREARVYDYRNLGYLEGSIVDYLNDRDIHYILYPTEMDFIYANRPLWNDLYGNVYPYYDELQTYLAESCELIAEFDSPIYAMRIVRYIGEEPASLRIYRVKKLP